MSISNDPYNGQDLLILVVSIVFILSLVFVSLYAVCHRACGFCERYCICQGWCCVFDRNAYQQEREHLRRLRELRQRREEFALATFTQIPGPIPDIDLRTRVSLHNLTSLGFILVTPVSVRQDTNSIQMRDQLTAEQRRDILDRILSCKTYHAMEDIESITKNVEQEESQAPVQSYAFPLHEEPETPEKTCAICLDDFVEGESINDTSRCPHVFHKACLIEWLDRHDMCPCCRCNMITDTEWRRAASEGEMTATNDTEEVPSGIDSVGGTA